MKVQPVNLDNPGNCVRSLGDVYVMGQVELAPGVEQCERSRSSCWRQGGEDEKMGKYVRLCL